MTELTNLLLAQHRFLNDPSPANRQIVEQCMYAYQDARYWAQSSKPR